MAEYEYKGPGPHVDEDGTITRPGDKRDQEPDWGPWELVPEPEEEEAPAPPAPAVTPVPPFTAPPATAEGM